MYKIYSKPNCPYCDKAKALLTSKGLSYSEIILDVGQVKESGQDYFTVHQLKQMIPGVRTVPQIFKDNVLIGGFDSLKKMIS